MEALQTLIEHTGMIWVYALSAAFVSMIAESAKPAPVEDGEAPTRGFVGVLMGFAGMATVFMLAVYGYWAAYVEHAYMERFVALGVVFAVAALASIIGLSIARAPGISPVLYAVAPVLTLAVFAFTAYFSWESVRAALDLYIFQNL
jgi:hypothetical protein